MKTYRRHNCDRRHRSYNTFARCIWGRRAIWVKGEGPYALLAWCRVLSVSLWPTEEDACWSMDFIDRTCCGGFCHGDHEVIRLDRDA
jgi:hypothetical protein